MWWIKEKTPNCIGVFDLERLEARTRIHTPQKPQAFTGTPTSDFTKVEEASVLRIKKNTE